MTGTDAIFDRARAMRLTLNGRPAQIYGSRLEFPAIAETDANGCGIIGGMSGNWPWRTVSEILGAGGAFFLPGYEP